MTTLATLAWDGSHLITQDYGCTALTVEPYWEACPAKHKHTGLDVAMYKGTPLYSPVVGKVVHVSYALLAITDLVRCYWFVHIDSAVATLGQWVVQRQLVAYSGNKVPAGGATTGPHLHVEVQNHPGALLSYYAPKTGAFVEVAGALNNPATSLNPLPYLSGLASDQLNTQQEFGETMTDDEITAKFDLIRQNQVADRNAILAAIGKVTVAAPTVDFTAVLAAVADLKAHPNVASDPTLAAKIDALTQPINALGKHLGVGTP